MDKRTIDWERIELDYRSGILTLREIASAHGITHTYVRAHAKKAGWERDLSARIIAKAEAIASKAAVSTIVSNERAVSDRETVDANALVLSDVMIGRKSSVGEMCEIVVGQVKELKEHGGDLKERVFLTGKVAETMKTLLGMQADVWNLASQPKEKPPAPPMDDLELAREMAFIWRSAAERLPVVTH